GHGRTMPSRPSGPSLGFACMSAATAQDPTIAPSHDRTSEDRTALSVLGVAVRKRLAANPSVRRVPARSAEIFTIDDVFAPDECAKLIAMIDAVARPS